MPFFGHKFTSLKFPVRQKLPFHSSKNLSTDKNDKISIKIGNYECFFNEGEWRSVGGDKTDVYSENEHLNKLSIELNEENNLLKLKIDILLDMLTEELCKAEQWKGTHCTRNLTIE